MDSLCFIGNSHINQFNLKNFKNIHILYEMGASIKGLTNPNSKLQMAEKIRLFSENNPNTTLLFFLGQVDVEFGYYYKCVVDNIKYNINDYIDDLIIRYEKYLKTLTTNFYILSINPTVIKNIEIIYRVTFCEDNGKNGEYSSVIPNFTFEDMKKYVDESFDKRFEINKLFNTKLEEMCNRNNFKFINIWDVLFENGKLKEKYLPINDDHHLRIPHDFDLLNYIYVKINNIESKES